MNNIKYSNIVFPESQRKTNKWLIKIIDLIEYRRKNPLSYIPLIKDRPKNYIYNENHHIIPRCWFVQNNLPIDNSSENMVRLTFKEHILIHIYLKKYFYENNTKMYYSMTNAIFRMCKNTAIVKYIEEDTKLKNFYLKILQQHKSDLSKFISNTFGKSHLNKVQIFDTENKIRYVDKNDIDLYITKFNWKTHDMICKEKYEKYYHYCRDELLSLKHKLKFNYTLAYNKILPLEKTLSKQVFIKYLKKYITEVKELDLFFKQENEKQKILCQANKRIVSHNRDLSQEEIDFLKTHSIKESIKKLNLSYHNIVDHRKKHNIRRQKIGRKLSGRTKSEILKERIQNSTKMHKSLNSKKIYIINNKFVEQYKQMGFVTQQEYIFNRYYQLLNEILKYDLKTAIQNLNYDGSPNIDAIVLLCQKHLGKKYIPDDLAIKLRKKYGTLKRLVKKPNHKPFTPFEDEYIMTHYIKDAAIKFDRSNSIIKKRRKYLRMLANNCK